MAITLQCTHNIIAGKQEKDMEYQIIQTIKSQEDWTPKIQGVILVKNEQAIEWVWQYLCQQDDYWESYKNLIKLAPEKINSVEDLKRLCEYVGKTDIYNSDKFFELAEDFGVEVFIYQYSEELY